MNEPAPVVFVVDDDASIRDGLRRLFSSVGLTVQSFPDAEAFLAGRHPDAPGCIVLDVRLPDSSGLELQAALVQRGEPLPILFLSGFGDIPMSVRAMKAGAVEFLTKPCPPETLVAAVRQAIENDRLARVERHELAALRQRYESLTARERGVLAGVVAGLRNKEIAGAFGTREFTVKEQRAQMLTKMQVASVAELVRIATRLALPPFTGGG